MGDKYKILEQIIQYFPENIDNFIEPFTGGGTVFLNVEANKYFLNDIDPYLIKLHKFLNLYSDNKLLFFETLTSKIAESGLSHSYSEDTIPKQLRIDYPKTYFAKYNKENYLKVRNKFNKDKNDMFALYLLLIYGFNRMLRFNSKGDFNLPVGNVDLNMNVINALNDYFDIVKNKQLKFKNLDYKLFLKQCDYKINDFVYFDPPYLITSSEYNKLWNEKNEKELLKTLDILNEKNIKWGISNLVSDDNKGTYNSIFANWMQRYNVHEINSYYISFNNNRIRPTREVFVTNYAKS